MTIVVIIVIVVVVVVVLIVIAVEQFLGGDAGVHDLETRHAERFPRGRSVDPPVVEDGQDGRGAVEQGVDPGLGGVARLVRVQRLSAVATETRARGGERGLTVSS